MTGKDITWALVSGEAGNDGPGQRGSRSAGDVGRVGFNRKCPGKGGVFFGYKSWDDVLNLGIFGFFGDDILETTKRHQESFQKKFFWEECF